MSIVKNLSSDIVRKEGESGFPHSEHACPGGPEGPSTPAVSHMSPSQK